MATTRTAGNAYALLCYRDAAAMIDWLVRAFGATEHMRVEGEDGAIVHAELRIGDGIVMVGSFTDDRLKVRSPRELAGLTGGVYVGIDHVDALHDRAKAAGAEIVVPLHDTHYGSRDFAALDPEGQLWCFGTYRPELDA
jgi:uncharacterized glyoxalase superfamily protein PhnB